MLARLNNIFLNVSLVKKPTRVWRYDFVEGFNKKVKDSGLTVFEKFINLSEIDEIFDVGFSVKYHGEYFGCLVNEKENTLVLRTSNQKQAKKHGFLASEYDHGVVVLWTLKIDIDACEEFRFYKITYLPDYFVARDQSKTVPLLTTLSKEEWLKTHHKLVFELSPWNYRKPNN